MSKSRSSPPSRVLPAALGAVLALGVGLGLAAPAGAATIIDEWASVKPPPPPALAAVKLSPKTTALLVLDLEHQTCNTQHRPRCVGTLATVHGLLARARAAGMPEIYSLAAHTTAADIWPEVKPAGPVPMVSSGPDKFLHTELAAILRARGITTVIIVGTASEGAVIATASEAALRGFKVVVPLDGVSSGFTYAEQYMAWHLMNAPVIAGHVVLSRTDMLSF